MKSRGPFRGALAISFATVFFFVVIQHLFVAVSAEIDSDLVFDFDDDFHHKSVHINHKENYRSHPRKHRTSDHVVSPVEIPDDSLEKQSLRTSEPDEHWISSGVKRIKRFLFFDSPTTTEAPKEKKEEPKEESGGLFGFNFFNTKTTTTTESPTTTEEDQDIDQGLDQNINQHFDQKINQGFDQDIDQDPFNEIPEQESQNYEELPTFSHSSSSRERRNSEEYAGPNDDEDLNNEGSTSGVGVTTDRQPQQRAVYRVTFVYHEPYRPEYENRNSEAYKQISEILQRGLLSLFENDRNELGETHVTLIRVLRRVDDTFTSLVSLDIACEDFPGSQKNHEYKINNIIENAVRNKRRISDIVVSDEEFSFKHLEGPPRPTSQCRDHDEMQCRSGECVPVSARCDGINHCRDSSDELGCRSEPEDDINEVDTDDVSKNENDDVNREPEEPDFGSGEPDEPEHPSYPVHPIHPVTETGIVDTVTIDPLHTVPIPIPKPVDGCRGDDAVRCRHVDGHHPKSICSDQICDGEPDCPDGTDEENCPSYDCARGEFVCDVNRCIPEHFKCDGVPNCDDRTDELHCDTTPSPGCSSDEFECDSGECIPSHMKCNNIRECYGGEDEEGCPCHPDEYTCTNGQCIEKRRYCDGHRDCSDYSDEAYCRPVPAAHHFKYICPRGRFMCGDETCISVTVRCDGKIDCPRDDLDETGCPCAMDQWQCDFGTCIPLYLRCDGSIDCPNDNSDERFCPGCLRHQFKCRDGTCIDEKKKCDRNYDCPDNSDEQTCPCTDDQFKCKNMYCIPMDKRCDGLNHCQDGSDEEDCPECQSYEFSCRNGDCIDQLKRCNGQRDCSDGSDEESCTCSDNQFRCSDGNCIPLSHKCNRVSDCNDGGDEENCPHERCQYNEFQCQSGECINRQDQCNGYRDCVDGTDEDNCDDVLKCGNGFWRCLDGISCIPNEMVCNNEIDCVDNSDESQDECIAKSTEPPVTVPGLSPCKTNEIQCSEGYCIESYKLCNGIRDCISGSDELNCTETLDEEVCTLEEFQCDDKTCISDKLYCDTVTDCPDGSDERDCPTPAPCPENAFICRDGSCVRSDAKCDRIHDCADYSDEEGCGVCSPSEYRCDDGECIRDYQRCDDQPDCRDGSDERDCKTQCFPGQFRCGNGLCLDERRVCDGRRQCTDGSDEINCPGERPTTPPPAPTCQHDEFQCVVDGNCISVHYVCDGTIDCKDESDENDCEPASTSAPTSPQCNYDEFQCLSDKSCIDIRYECDSHNDCPDGSDETDCPTTEPPECQSQCDDGECISTDMKCDGVRDCFDGSDERNCPVKCEENEFQCHSDRRCIPIDRRCDRRRDCVDESDERGCDPHGCKVNEFRCNSGQCIPSYLQCDGNPHCNDRSDEVGCSPRPEPPTQRPPEPDNNKQSCSRNEFRCENGPCIRRELRCDGKRDCPFDESDELDCPNIHLPQDGLNLKTYPNSQIIKESREVVFQCRDESPNRAHVRWIRGNGLSLPPGSRDNKGRLEIPNIQVDQGGSYICEAFDYPASTPGRQIAVHLTVEPYVAPTTPPHEGCALSEATCSNGECIDKAQVCDGKYDCTDGSDEMRCSPHGCEPNQFRCNNKKCVSKSWRCDGQDDCGDRSDEERCATNPPDEPCRYEEFACRSGSQCIPKTYHCDHERDCDDGSDEVGCSPIYIISPPKPVETLDCPATLIITCTATGVPTPEIVWRRNWGHVPDKCSMTSVDGLGTLTCPGITDEDTGAYSCEAITATSSKLATPDTQVTCSASQGDVCPAGFFNEIARQKEECLKCFCFGVSSQCNSADLYTFQIPSPVVIDTLTGVNFKSGEIELSNSEPVYKSRPEQLRNTGRNSAQLSQSDVDRYDTSKPYLVLSQGNFHGNQLKSYGGYLKYTIRAEGGGYPLNDPDVIIVGNGYVLAHTNRRAPSGETSVRLFEGEWDKIQEYDRPTKASREEIMMALAQIERILIKMQYHDDTTIDTTISDISLDSAGIANTGLGKASFVEQCICPAGYTGLSCEACAPGYQRHTSGPWLGHCFKPEVKECSNGFYGDPSRGIPCKVCPCPLTSPSNQFGRTCSLGSDGQVNCNCPIGYEGRRCETCSAGYTGNPTTPGDSCRKAPCNPEGSLSLTPDPYTNNCVCKDFTTGPFCDQCKANSFYLDSSNRFGCISCFCMGITNECTSSTLLRDRVSTAFTSSTNDFGIVESQFKNNPIKSDISLDSDKREIVYSRFTPNRPDIYYWKLPSRFLGDKVSSYGGDLKYTLRYVPAPGGYSKNSAPDVEIVGNDVSLLYFSKDHPQPNNAETLTVPLLEQYWQRSDGLVASREHFLMALADLEDIFIKATYTTTTEETALIQVSLDTAGIRPGGARASAVEQCRCPIGYSGLSCEDCDVGYTRTGTGLYLGLCEPCACNGHSASCDPDSGTCMNCQDNTEGDYCDVCREGYVGEPTNGVRCLPALDKPGETSKCNGCDPRGTESCDNLSCRCKLNVIGENCDQCRPGTFGLSESNIDGCLECYCSGATNQCHEGNTLSREQIPMQILDNNHDFALTDSNGENRITDGFSINIPMNEICYDFSNERRDRLFWSVPATFTGNQVTSYGGNLTLSQKYTTRGSSERTSDNDIILYGNGIKLIWNNRNEIYSNRPSTSSVPLIESNWNRLDSSGIHPASRADLISVLAGLNNILVRATQAPNLVTSCISDIYLDTAVARYTGQKRANEVELCKCPDGYRGTSCETCAQGYFSDSTSGRNVCRRCPCSEHADSCAYDRYNRIVCNCAPGYNGRTCDTYGDRLVLELVPTDVKEEVGQRVKFVCAYHFSEPLTIEFVDKTSHNKPIKKISPPNIPGDAKFNGIVEYETTIANETKYVIECIVRDESGEFRDKLTARICTTKQCTEHSTPKPIDPPGTEPPPTIIVSISEPTIQIVDVGATVRLRCTGRSIISTPRPIDIQWRKEGGSLPRDRAIDDRRGLLVITNVQVSDSGIYICQATDEHSIVTGTASITVGGNRNEPPRVNIVPDYLDINEGEYAELRCDVTGIPLPDITWTKITGRLSSQATVQNGVLRIPSVRASDEGEYRCTATNIKGVDSQSTVIYIRGSPVPPPPPPTLLIINPPEYIGIPSDNVILTCRGEPGIPYRWHRYDGRMPLDSSAYEGVLTIRNARIEDSGIYVCTQDSPSSPNGVQTINVRVTIEASSQPPIVSVSPARLVISQGDSAEIFCDVRNSPDSSIKWTKLGESFPSNVYERGNYLHITNAKVNDRGVYVCIATSPSGITGKNSSVVEIDRRDAPRVELYPEVQQTVNVGGSVLLQCRIVGGTPQPKLSWVKEDGGRLSNRIEVMDGGILRFNQITPAESGSYICRAENSAGSVEVTGIIIVRQPPIIKLSPSSIVHVRYGERMSIECYASGDPAPNVQWINTPELLSLPEDQRRHLPTSRATFEIYSMGPHYEGSYTCVASNAAGTVEERVQVILDDDDGSYPERGDLGPQGGNHVRPPTEGEPSILPEDDFRIPVNGTASMTCRVLDVDGQAVGHHVTREWVRADGRPLPPGHELRDGVLKIYNVQPEDAGTYDCIGQSREGRILFKAKARLTVYDGPSIQLSPQRQIVRPGDTAQITCSVTGSYTPFEIQWSAVGRNMPASVHTRSGVLQFNRIEVADAGRYQCRAQNTKGDIAESTADVIVQDYKETQRPHQRDQTAYVGSNVQLRCESGAYPGDRARVRWNRIGDRLPAGHIIEGDILTLVNVQATDGGMYQCQVTSISGVTENHVNLRIDHYGRSCPRGYGQCKNGICIKKEYFCNGRYDCSDGSDELYCRKRKHIELPQQPRLRIVSSKENIKVGDDVDVTCTSSDRDAPIQWSKVHGRLSSSAHISGNVLRLISAQSNDQGLYRCTSRSREGIQYHDDINIDVSDESDYKDEPEVLTINAELGSGVYLECNTDIDPPIRYSWTLKGQALNSSVDTHKQILHLAGVTEKDAGRYICTVSNGITSMDIPTNLLVTGIVPHFSQAPNSYLTYKSIPQAYLELNLEISFRPISPNGMILYNSQYSTSKGGDFVSLSLSNGVPELRFNLGGAPTVVRSDRPITMEEWHTIKIERIRKEATMYVDENGPYTATSLAKYAGLDLHQPLYLGGVPSYNDIAPHSGPTVGFVGCISRLVIGQQETDLMSDAIDRHGITNCETCAESPCRNGGKCQEAQSAEGYKCICSEGFSGNICDRIGEACYPGACGTGRCIDERTGFKCLCPLGRTGRRCENEINISDPAFAEDAYIALPSPKRIPTGKGIKFELAVKPSEDRKDGIILYSGESEKGHGDFISIALRNGYLEFKFDTGVGPTTVIRSNRALPVGEWTRISAGRHLGEGKLIINDEEAIVGKSAGKLNKLTLRTLLYIGGVDQQKIVVNNKVGVNNGFTGCIRNVKISDVNMDLVRQMIDSANVQQCVSDQDGEAANEVDTSYESPCDNNPCQHGGHCRSLGGDQYSCSCTHGHSGRDCEIVPSVCVMLRPCQNGGTCRDIGGKYLCSCPLGFSGLNCEDVIEITTDAMYHGDGYIELSRDILPHISSHEREVIALSLSTNHSNGLVLWHGQQRGQDGRNRDYLSLAVVDGYLEFSYDLGEGAAVIRNGFGRVDDGRRHNVVLKRTAKEGSIEVDGQYTEYGESKGITSTLNCDGNIFLGGAPDIFTLTGGLYTQGFQGCVHGLEIQDNYSMNLGKLAISAVNVAPCAKDDYDEDFEDSTPRVH